MFEKPYVERSAEVFDKMPVDQRPQRSESFQSGWMELLR